MKLLMTLPRQVALLVNILGGSRNQSPFTVLTRGPHSTGTFPSFNRLLHRIADHAEVDDLTCIDDRRAHWTREGL